MATTSAASTPSRRVMISVCNMVARWLQVARKHYCSAFDGSCAMAAYQLICLEARNCARATHKSDPRIASRLIHRARCRFHSAVVVKADCTLSGTVGDYGHESQFVAAYLAGRISDCGLPTGMRAHLDTHHLAGLQMTGNDGCFIIEPAQRQRSSGKIQGGDVGNKRRGVDTMLWCSLHFESRPLRRRARANNPIPGLR